MYVVTVTARYPRDADAVFAEACRFDELREAMRGLARYDGLPEGAARQGMRFTVDITLFGVAKNPGHVMEVERLDPVTRVLQSREHNPRVARWDHTLTVQPEGQAVSGPTGSRSRRAGSPRALPPMSIAAATAIAGRKG